MRIGFDAKRIFENSTGLGVYSRTLVRNLRSAYPELSLVLFAPNLKNSPYAPDFLNPHWPEIVTPSLSWERPLWRPWLMSRDVERARLSIFHGLSNELPIGIGRARCRSIVTIHDLIFRRYPKQYRRIDGLIYDFKFRRACRSADRVIAVSEATRLDIIEQYGIPAEKTAVVYQGCDPSFFERIGDERLVEVRNRYRIPSEFLLSVGSIIERKNLLGLVQGWALLPKGRRLPLVVVGKGGGYALRVRQWLTERGLAGEAHFLEGVPQVDLPPLYQSAAAVAYLSRYEGFGIPVLEAIASRRPVVTSNLSSMPEAGGRAAFLANPDSAEEVASALDSVLYDGSIRERLLMEGPAHLERFSAKRLCSDLMAEYQTLL